MTKAIAVGLSIALSVGTAVAQPAKTPRPAPAPKTPTPTPTPAPKTPAPTPAPDAKPDTKTTEKAGTDETLQTGGDERPWAKGVSADQKTAALRAFHEGNVQLNDGLFVKAVEQYRIALKQWDHPAVHYNLALALLNLDQPIEVYDSLQKAIQFGPAPLEKEKYEHAKEYMLLVEKQLANIDVSCAKPGAKVSIDGKEVFTAPGSFKGRVRIGKHTFVAEKPGYATGLDAPFIGPNETFRIELKLYTADELTRYKRKWDKTWVPYTVIGTGVVVGLIAGALELSAKSSYKDFDTAVARCSSDTGSNGGCDVTSPNIASLRDSGDAKRTMGYVGYGVAGAAIVTGAVLVYLNRSQAYQISSDDYRREQLHKETPVTVTPIVAPDMAGAMVFGHF
jgi:hypothetical protein